MHAAVEAGIRLKLKNGRPGIPSERAPAPKQVRLLIQQVNFRSVSENYEIVSGTALAAGKTLNETGG
jgi:hypothetical protein